MASERGKAGYACVEHAGSPWATRVPYANTQLYTKPKCIVAYIYTEILHQLYN